MQLRRAALRALLLRSARIALLVVRIFARFAFLLPLIVRLAILVVRSFVLVEIVATEFLRERFKVEALLGIAVPDENGALEYVFAAEIGGIPVELGAIVKVFVRCLCSRAARDTPSKL